MHFTYFFLTIDDDVVIPSLALPVLNPLGLFVPPLVALSNFKDVMLDRLDSNSPEAVCRFRNWMAESSETAADAVIDVLVLVVLVSELDILP